MAILSYTLSVPTFPPPPAPASPPENPPAIEVMAKDTLKLNFGATMKVNDALRDPASYTITAVDAGRPVTLREIRPGDGVSATYALLVITAPTNGQVYEVAIVSSDVVNTDGDPLAETTARFKARLTKIDNLVVNRPSLYDTRPKAIYRNLLNAIGLEDERIGGAQDEDEDALL